MDLNGFSLGVPVDCPLRLSLGLQYMFVLKPLDSACGHKYYVMRNNHTEKRIQDCSYFML